MKTYRDKKAEFDKKVAQQLEANKKTLEADLASLNEITAQLRKGLATVREGQVIYQAGEVVGSAVLSAGKPLTDAKQVLGGFLTTTNASVLERLNIADKQLMVLWVAQIDFDQMATVLSGDVIEQVVRVVASGNIVYGEPVIARLEHYPNKLISRNGLLKVRPSRGLIHQYTIVMGVGIITEKVIISYS